MDKAFFFSPKTQTGSRTHPDSYSMGTGILSWGVNRSEREVDDGPPSTSEAKNGWSYTSSPPVCLYLIDNFTRTVVTRGRLL